MIASTWNHSKHTGLLSLASSNLESRVDVLPDFEAREEVVRSELGLSWNETYTGTLAERPSQRNATHWEIGQKEREAYLVSRLRIWRPDVVVVSCDFSGSEAEREQFQKQLLNAIDECKNPNRLVFSPESGISLPAWEVKKVFTTTPVQAQSLSLSSDQLLAGSGRMMSEFLHSVYSLGFSVRRTNDVHGRSGGLELTLLRSSSFTDGARRDLFGGFVQDEKTNRRANLRAEGSFQGLQDRIQSDLALKKLVALPGPKLVKDRAWERTVDTLIGNRVDRAVSQVLFEMAEESRKQGYWNRWQACLGRIVRIHPNEGVAEEAWRQMIVYSGSQEVQHAVRTLHKQEFESNDSSEQHSAVALGSVPPASPFERGATNGVAILAWS